jgi:hypothetical protein
MTGGSNWMIREVSSTPIRVRNVMPAAADPNWRVTPDKETGAWRVEQRQPGGWATVSEFLIQAAMCQPEESLAAAPEPAPNPEEPKAEDAMPAAPGGVFVIGAPPPRTRQPEEPKPER